nr:hypothetical protein [Nocardia alni]
MQVVDLVGDEARVAVFELDDVGSPVDIGVLDMDRQRAWHPSAQLE